MTKIACIGDSITSGFTLLNPSRDSYPSLLQNMLGSNDTKRRNWDREIFRRDYRKIASSYMELPSRPRVCLIAPVRIFRVWGIPLMGLYPETMEEGVRPAIHEIAADLGLQCIDLKEIFNDSSYCIDGVHPQRKGTRMIAEFIFKALFKD